MKQEQSLQINVSDKASVIDFFISRAKQTVVRSLGRFFIPTLRKFVETITLTWSPLLARSPDIFSLSYKTTNRQHLLR